MSDEESFVVLGSSPMPSLISFEERQPDTLSSLDPAQTSQAKSLSSQPPVIICPNEIQNDCMASSAIQVAKPSLVATKVSNDSTAHSSTKPETALLNSKLDSASGGAVELNSKSDKEQQISFASVNSNRNINGGSAVSSPDSSLAAGFIMGSVDASILKTSIYSQFPSLSMQACAEDIIKFQNIMDEYIKMKDMLMKVNTNIKMLYDRTYQWKQTMQSMETHYKEELEKCQKQIVDLRNENLNLKREIDTKIEQMKICEDVRANEQTELIQGLSEKSAQISNMRAQIEKLEQQQLASFEYIPKNKEDSKEKPDYISRIEHEHVVKTFERKMSELLAEKLEVDDMKKQYIDEITCLKVNLTASEELIKQLRADVALLKSKDDEKTKLFCEYEEERNRTREEFVLLRQQVEVYSHDFEMERVARQNLAGEKDQLLQDLRALQRKNQELIEEAQRRFGSMDQQQAVASSSTTTASNAARPIRVLRPPSPTDVENCKYRCPVCSKECVSLSLLQNHVNLCLDRNN